MKVELIRAGDRIAKKLGISPDELILVGCEVKRQVKTVKYDLKQLRYDIRLAGNLGIHEHPQKQMQKLGYKVIDCVPQSLYDCWWFTVESIIEPLPEYLTEISYDFYFWHGKAKGAE